MERSEPFYCFVDTNTLLHFTDFDEVDWPKALLVPTVRLVVTTTVMRELDRFKDDYQNERRRNRARAILPKLDRLLRRNDEAGLVEIRPGVTITDISREPNIDWERFGLDPQTADDRLLASVLEFSENLPDARVMVLTNDFPLQRKVVSYGLEWRDPKDFLQRLEFPTNAETKIKDLQRELQQLRSRIPVLDLGYWHQERKTQVLSLPVPATDSKKRAEAALTETIANEQHHFKQIVESVPSWVLQEAATAFISEYEDYLRDFENAARKEKHLEYGPRYELPFVIENTGTAPALDVDIEMEFPEDSFVVGINDEHHEAHKWEYIGFSKRPEPFWEDRIKPPLWPGYYEDLLSNTSAVLMHTPQPRGPLYFVGDHSRVSYEIPKLRPKSKWFMDRVALYLPPGTNRGFAIEYIIQADPLPEPITGHLHIRFK